MATAGPVLVDGVTLTAGAADWTSDPLQVTPYGAVAIVWIVNGATGPDVAGSVQTQVTIDGVMWADHETAVAGDLVAASTSSAVVEIPGGVAQARFVCGSNTAQDVTVTVHAGQVSS